MHWLRFAALLVVCTLLQESFLDVISVAGTRPDILLILVVFFAIFLDPHDAIITSFTIGLAHDLIGTSMGPGILSFGILGTGLCYLSSVISLRQMPFQAAAIFLFVIIITFVMVIFIRIQKQLVPTDTFGMYLGSPLYSAIVGPFLFLPIAWWMHIKVKGFRRRR